MQAGSYKICPRCQTPADLNAPQCLTCGRAYKTQFAPTEQTQVFGSAPMPPQPPQYAQPSYPAAPPQYAPPVQHYVPPGMIQVPMGTHSVPAAIFLSFFLIGMGQVYNKQTNKGLALLFCPIALGILLFTLGFLTGGVTWLFLIIVYIFMPIYWIVNVIDAALVAGKLNRGQMISTVEWF